ncbi:Uncharacterised protein [uncultured archaeon]|nr:Uncharacterised protein [uncultured archaeon]
MTEEKTQIENPWGVYGWFLGSGDIGKIVEDSKCSCYIQYCEGQRYPAECWDSEWVHKFDNPLKAIEYFLLHNHDGFSKEQVIEHFLRDFPSEKKTLKRLLEQSPPKCTQADIDSGKVEESHDGSLHETHTKDRFPHPNKKY